jgi:hypothetical protein
MSSHSYSYYNRKYQVFQALPAMEKRDNVHKYQYRRSGESRNPSLPPALVAGVDPGFRRDEAINLIN